MDYPRDKPSHRPQDGQLLHSPTNTEPEWHDSRPLVSSHYLPSAPPSLSYHQQEMATPYPHGRRPLPVPPMSRAAASEDLKRTPSRRALPLPPAPPTRTIVVRDPVPDMMVDEKREMGLETWGEVGDEGVPEYVPEDREPDQREGLEKDSERARFERDEEEEREREEEEERRRATVEEEMRSLVLRDSKQEEARRESEDQGRRSRDDHAMERRRMRASSSKLEEVEEESIEGRSLHRNPSITAAPSYSGQGKGKAVELYPMDDGKRAPGEDNSESNLVSSSRPILPPLSTPSSSYHLPPPGLPYVPPSTTIIPIGPPRLPFLPPNSTAYAPSSSSVPPLPPRIVHKSYSSPASYAPRSAASLDRPPLQFDHNAPQVFDRPPPSSSQGSGYVTRARDPQRLYSLGGPPPTGFYAGGVALAMVTEHATKFASASTSGPIIESPLDEHGQRPRPVVRQSWSGFSQPSTLESPSTFAPNLRPQSVQSHWNGGVPPSMMPPSRPGSTSSSRSSVAPMDRGASPGGYTGLRAFLPLPPERQSYQSFPPPPQQIIQNVPPPPSSPAPSIQAPIEPRTITRQQSSYFSSQPTTNGPRTVRQVSFDDVPAVIPSRPDSGMSQGSSGAGRGGYASYGGGLEEMEVLRG